MSRAKTSSIEADGALARIAPDESTPAEREAKFKNKIFNRVRAMMGRDKRQ
jgi:hypothetical protein